jgi:hypothetical protein
VESSEKRKKDQDKSCSEHVEHIDDVKCVEHRLNNNEKSFIFTSNNFLIVILGMNECMND